jgi:Mrp family chromosome partitioning ATPase
MLASIADRTLLVIASGRVDRALGKDTVDQLQKANASIIGVALNFINGRYNHYGHYYRHYDKYRYDRSYDENNSNIPDSFQA